MQSKRVMTNIAAEITRTPAQEVLAKPETARTIETIRKVNEVLDTSHTKYGYFGGAARSAFMQRPINQKSDVDVLLLAPESQRQAIEQQLDSVRAKYPAVKIDTSLSSMFHVDTEGNPSLEWGRTKIQLAKEVLDTYPVDVKDADDNITQILALHPETVLHINVFLGRKFRQKDWKNGMALARFIRKDTTFPEMDHELLEPFHEFGKELRSKYPLRQIQGLWRTLVKSLPPELKAEVLDLYETTGGKRLRELLNRGAESVCLENPSKKPK